MTAVAESEQALARQEESAEGIAEARARPSRRRLAVLAVVLAAATGAGGWMLAHRGLESTDDAQIDADVVGLAARTSGVVVKVSFTDNERVERGRVLVELDPEPARARLAQAEANLEAARAAAIAAETDARLATTSAKATSRAATASLSAASAGASASRDQIGEAHARVTAAETARAQAKTDFDRVERLFRTGSLSQAQLDQATTARDTAEANVAQARAHLASLESTAVQAMSRVGEASAKVEQTRDVDAFVALAEARARGARAKVAELEAARDLAALELSFTKIVAPEDGVVSKKSAAVGQTLAMGAPIAQLVPARAVWVTANFKETQIGRMQGGQHAEIEVDALPDARLRGTVESLSAATGARFALLPPDNATGNFTKVVQRVPVRIRLDDADHAALRPGMSVEVTVDTRK